MGSQAACAGNLAVFCAMRYLWVAAYPAACFPCAAQTVRTHGGQDWPCLPCNTEELTSIICSATAASLLPGMHAVHCLAPRTLPLPDISRHCTQKVK